MIENPFGKGTDHSLHSTDTVNTQWMDGWPAMETDAGRAVMKTPATKDKDLFKVVLPTPVATTLSISRLSEITW